MSGRWPTWVVAPALAAPLVGLTAWILYGALTADARPEAAEASALAAGALPEPSGDFPAERLEERVNGAADALRADGCRRLLYWRFETPPADGEALVFNTEEGARTVLAREAGKERTDGPGDEAQLSAQTAYFRRGPVYVRIFLDPGVPESPALQERAEEIDRALAAGASL